MRHVVVIFFLLAGCVQPTTDPEPAAAHAPPPTPEQPSAPLQPDADRLSFVSNRSYDTFALIYEVIPHGEASCSLYLNTTMLVDGADPQIWRVSWFGNFTFSSTGTNAPVAHAYVSDVEDLRPPRDGEGQWIAHTSSTTLDGMSQPVRILQAASHVGLAPGGADIRGNGDPTRSLDWTTDCAGQADVRVEMAVDPVFLSLHSVDGVVGAGWGSGGAAVGAEAECICNGTARAFVGQGILAASLGIIEISGSETWRWAGHEAGMVTAFEGGAGPLRVAVDVARSDSMQILAGGFKPLDLALPAAKPLRPRPLARFHGQFRPGGQAEGQA